SSSGGVGPTHARAVLRRGPGGSFVDRFGGWAADRGRLARADLAAAGDSFSEHAEGGGGGYGAGTEDRARDALPGREASGRAPSAAAFGRDSVTLSPAASRASACLLAHALLEHQAVAIARLIEPFASFDGASSVGICTGAGSAASVGRPARRFSFAQGVARWASARDTTSYEPHSEAAEDPETDPRLARAERLFADDAGARRRARREQGHGLRARRGAHPQGRAGARAEQGTLFVDR